MNRTMIDFTHANLPNVLHMLGNWDMAAIYGTGSSSIEETAADIAAIRASGFGDRPLVMIDQGFTGSPQPLDTVRDVESGAWSAQAAVNTSDWKATDPTIYCARESVDSLASAGWHGAVWLADPMFAGTTPPVLPNGMTCVAVQNVFALNFDGSIVFAEFWPGLSPVRQAANPQPGWRYCEKHKGLFWGPAQQSSRCAAGGTCVPFGYIYELPWRPS